MEGKLPAIHGGVVREVCRGKIGGLRGDPKVPCGGEAHLLLDAPDSRPADVVCSGLAPRTELPVDEIVGQGGEGGGTADHGRVLAVTVDRQTEIGVVAALGPKV